MARYVQYGCGFSVPEGWMNFDSSPTLRAERTPFFGRFLTKNNLRFPDRVKIGNIVRGLPIEDSSADGVYASHVLEHLTRAELDTALRNTYRMLRPGGIFRLIVPDLEARVRRYIAKLETGEEHANDWFMTATNLGLERRPTSIMGKLSRLAGGSMHLWMWDFSSLKAALERAGFVSVRRCQLGDSGDPMFSLVEDPNRFHDGNEDISELAIQATKPHMADQ